MSEYVDRSEQLMDEVFQELDQIKRTQNGGLDYAELIKRYDRSLYDAKEIVSKCSSRNPGWDTFKESLDKYPEPEILKDTLCKMREWSSLDEDEFERLSIIDVTDYIGRCICISEYAKSRSEGRGK